MREKKYKKGEGEEEGREFPNQERRGRGRGEFSKESVRTHKRRAKKPRERREKRGWRLSRFAPSVTRVVIFCVSRVSLGGLRKNRGFSWS